MKKNDESQERHLKQFLPKQKFESHDMEDSPTTI